MSDTGFEVRYEQFTATHDLMSNTVRVDGEVIVEHAGVAVHIEPHEGNPGINPQMLTLDLVFRTTGESPSRQPVHYDQPWSDDLPYTEVDFRVRDADVEPPPPLKITTVS
jgi:hypothetical protein